MIIGLCYKYGKWRIRVRQMESWETWAATAERRLREFEGLYGDERILAEESFNEWTLNGEGEDGWYFGERELEEQRTPFYEDDILAADMVTRSSLWGSTIYPADSRSLSGENMSQDSRLTAPRDSAYFEMIAGTTGAYIFTPGEYEMDQLVEEPAAEIQDNMVEIRVAGEEVTVRST